jgi:hypothetical protein
MNKPNQYNWLIIVEGNTDVHTYIRLLPADKNSSDSFFIVSANGKNNVVLSKNWNKIQISDNTNLLDVVIHNIGRSNFSGIILVIDTDDITQKAFDFYKRNTKLSYIEQSHPTPKKINNSYWKLDELKGTKNIPIFEITVPMNQSGCLETDLLTTYGFPVEGQCEYSSFVATIQKASGKWNIPALSGGGNWWDENSRAKLDKFIYSALSCGFYVCRQEPHLPTEPIVITNIKKVMQDNSV